MTTAYVLGRIALLTVAGTVMGALVGALLVIAGPEPDPDLDDV